MIDYSKIIDNIFEGVLIIDENFRIIDINKSASEITGFSLKEAKGQHCFEILKTDVCSSGCPIKNLKGKEKSEQTIVNIITKDNEEKYIKVRVLKSNNYYVEIFQDATREIELEKRVQKAYKLEDIITSDEKLMEILSNLPKIAVSEVPVLIEGESGVGKEVFATAIKNLSQRKDKPFVKINCAALPDTLLESELFGYKKGAFTDAKKDKPGLFVQADKGTIFLDEIAEMSLKIQAKLLRAIETGEVIPLGGINAIKFDVRVISATNKNLIQEVKKEKFREDLFYRLNVVKIKISPLRERKKDIPLFVDYFINKLNIVHKKKIEGISEKAMNILFSHDYPGNIRELRNIIEHSFVFCEKGLINAEHLPDYIKTKTRTSSENKLEKERIIRILDKVKWNRKEAAKLLGINRTTLWRKMSKYNIS